MDPIEIDRRVIPAALEILGLPSSPELRVELLAIGLQESGFASRVQVVNGGGAGPARGFWQFEKGGGVKGVFNHAASREGARLLCRARDVAYDVTQIWMALEHDDVLAAGMARQLLLTDPRPLPGLDDSIAGWACYVRNWRPGKPHVGRWPANHRRAFAVVSGVAA